MCLFEEFLKCLYKYLIGTENINNNVIKKHIRKLEQLGELSFSPRIPQFKSAINLDHNLVQSIVMESKNWKLFISKYSLVDTAYHLHLDRVSTFKTVIYQILHQGSLYGSQKLKFSENININTDYDTVTSISLTQLRLVLLRGVIIRLLKFNNCYDSNLSTVDVYLTHKSNNCNKGKVILCAPVQCVCDNKNTETMSEEFYTKRSVDMRLMAEHKYGLRVISNPGWEEMFNKLGEAAVAIELLQIKTNRPVVCKINDPSSSSKGASFILYNCARLSTLIKEFEKRVDSKVYPPLPNFEEIDFTLLKQPEEWELLYVYLLQFPSVVQSCIKEIMENNVKIHNLCHALTSMCLTFSVYYQRVRILTEPRNHLFATLHARIHLVTCIKSVLENGLFLLNIEPVRQM